MSSAIALVASLIAMVPSPCPASNSKASGLIAITGSNFFDRSADLWDFGTGLDLAGIVPIGRALDLRLDTGGRWFEGSDAVVRDPGRAPRWGAKQGETPAALRAIPTTLSLVYRLEQWSNGRYWVPYLGGGFGLYDFHASYESAANGARAHDLFRAGWHVRGGVQLHRTSGLFIDVQTAVHAVDVPGHWASFFDLGVGVGAELPAH
ncbi:MAG: hypothetical protein U0527_08465 [Candidatus Eisenbacteria bacterium]